MIQRVVSRHSHVELANQIYLHWWYGVILIHTKEPYLIDLYLCTVLEKAFLVKDT